MRTLRTPRTNFEMFRKLCGEEAKAAVIIGTTKWSHVPDEVGLRREAELADADWKEIIGGGLGVHRFDGTRESAQSIVDVILKTVEQKNEHAANGHRPFEDLQPSAQSIINVISDRVDQRNAQTLGDMLRIQRDLIDLQRHIPETEAGKELRYTLLQVLELQNKVTAEIQAQRAASGDHDSYVLSAILRDKWDQVKKAFKQIRDAILLIRDRRLMNAAVSNFAVSCLFNYSITIVQPL
jgi:hypothetical protein